MKLLIRIKLEKYIRQGIFIGSIKIYKVRNTYKALKNKKVKNNYEARNICKVKAYYKAKKVYEVINKYRTRENIWTSWKLISD